MGAKSRLKQERREAGYKRERPEPKPITELIRDCQDHSGGYACPNCHGWLQQKTAVGSGI